MAKVEFSNLRKYVDELWLCGRCGDCSLADKTVSSNRGVILPCAIKNVLGFEVYSGKGRVMVLNDLLEENLEVNQDIVDWLYTCTTCGACQETCMATADGIHIPDMVEALRRDLLEAGYTMEKHEAIEESIIKDGNPYKESRNMRLHVFGDRKWPESAPVAYFVGCTSSYREKVIAQTTVALLDRAGIDFTVIPDEECCGSVLLRLGRDETFGELTSKNIAALKQAGVKTLVTACAGCYRTWKIDVPAQGLDYDFEVLHITEYLDRVVQEGKISFKSDKPLTVTYHDPCHLGRHAEVYEAPRRVIEAVENVTLVEMETNRRYAHCCGSGGGVKSSYGELADDVAGNRILEAEETGAKTLVTACPFCHLGLEDGARHTESSLRIVDLPTFLLPFVETRGKKKKEQRGEGADSALKRQFMQYLQKHPLIFDGLKTGAVIDYEVGEERFHVEVVDKDRIEVRPTRAENPDVVLTFSPKAVEKLTSFESEDDYAAQFGLFFKEPTDIEWIRFVLRRNIVKLLMKGYRKFAQKAGLI